MIKKKTIGTERKRVMGKLFKYMGMYWKSVLAILAILFVQAYCDLSLPAYTSDIVNVGIQQAELTRRFPKQFPWKK